VVPSAFRGGARDRCGAREQCYKAAVIFAEDFARWLLVAHVVLGVAVVGASTHLVIWTRGFPRGHFHRIDAIRRFSRIALALYALNFVVGNLIYPSYKVGVRLDYLEDGSAVARDRELRRDSRKRSTERYLRTRELYPDAPRSALAPAEESDEPPALARTAAKVARWFDVKEHWVALGLILAAAAAAILHGYAPKREGRAIGSIVFALAIGAAASAWLAAIVGVVVSSFRAIGPS